MFYLICETVVTSCVSVSCMKSEKCEHFWADSYDSELEAREMQVLIRFRLSLGREAMIFLGWYVS